MRRGEFRMKKVNVVAMITMVIFLLSNVSWAEMSKEKTQLEIKKRQPISQEWVGAASDVAKKSGTEDAIKIAEYLKDGFLAAPVNLDGGEASIVLREGKGKSSTVGIMPLVSGDEKLNAGWKAEYEANQAAFFCETGEGWGVISIRPIKVSRIWKGLIMLHEGAHAMASSDKAFVEVGGGNPKVERLFSEHFAYNIESSVLAKIYGQAMEKEILAEANAMKLVYAKEKEIIFPDYKSARYDFLEKVCGKSESEIERGMRISVFWVASVFKMMEIIGKDDDDIINKRLSFLDTMYSTGSMK